MNIAPLWLGTPAAVLPGRRVDNAELLARVRAAFTGSEADADRVERRLRSLFRICGSEHRYLEEENPTPLAAHAARAAEIVLSEAGIAAEALDYVIYGSIARTYYEPSTASEVAAMIGAKRAMPLDVTSACAGSLLAMHDLCGRMTMDDRLQVGLVSTSTITYGHITYAIPSPDAVNDLGAGLTLGNAATASLITRERPRHGGGRIVGLLAEGIPEHHALCRAPVGGHFVSQGAEIFALARHMPSHVKHLCDRVGWNPGDVDVYVSHQPSNRVLYEIAHALEVDPARIPGLHQHYGNTADSAVPLALWHLVRDGRVRPGQKLILAGAASGFVMASLAVVWE